MLLIRGALFVIGVALVGRSVLSAISTFVVPRGIPDRLTRFTFLVMRKGFDLRAARLQSYRDRDHLMAIYAPLTLIMLPGVWLSIVLAGFMLMFWAIQEGDWLAAFNDSGSSLLTLGFAVPNRGIGTALAFSEAAIGLLLLALLIAYLPTMYTAWSRREAAVALLQVRAGSPPSALEMIVRFHRIAGLERLNEIWPTWEAWFIDVEESHTSLAPLTFFRSHHPDNSWVTAAGVVLDVASLVSSTLDVPRNPERELCLRAGYLALREVAGFFRINFDHDPQPGDPISVRREEFDYVYDQLEADGVPLKSDREACWRGFAGWRVNYDAPLLALAQLTMAPAAAWSTDRLAGQQQQLPSAGRE